MFIYYMIICNFLFYLVEKFNNNRLPWICFSGLIALLSGCVRTIQKVITLYYIFILSSLKYDILVVITWCKSIWFENNAFLSIVNIFIKSTFSNWFTLHHTNPSPAIIGFSYFHAQWVVSNYCLSVCFSLVNPRQC